MDCAVCAGGTDDAFNLKELAIQGHTQLRTKTNCRVVREGFKEEVAFAMSLEEEGVGVLRSPG